MLLLANPSEPVLGASGAIFGMLGAFFVIQRRLGGNATQLLVLVAINLAIGFIPGFNIAWQAHVGGLVAGALVGLIFVETRIPAPTSLAGSRCWCCSRVVLVAVSLIHVF